MILNLNAVFTVTSEEAAGHSHLWTPKTSCFWKDKFTLSVSLSGPQFPNFQEKGYFFTLGFLERNGCRAGLGFWKGLWLLDVSICVVSAGVAQQAGALDWHCWKLKQKKTKTTQTTIKTRKLNLKPDILSFSLLMPSAAQFNLLPLQRKYSCQIVAIYSTCSKIWVLNPTIMRISVKIT